MSELLRRAATIARKDLLIEVRARQGFAAMLSFAALVLFIFSFALGPDPALQARVAPGLLWTAVIFTGTLSLTRLFETERIGDGITLLRMHGGDQRAVYLGKLAGNLCVLAALELVLFPGAALMFGLDLAGHFWSVLTIAVLGTVGFSLAGTFFAALTATLRGRELLLPLLLFPALIPVVIGSVGALDAVLAADPLGRLDGWLRLLAAYDVLLCVACVGIFPVLLEE